MKLALEVEKVGHPCIKALVNEVNKLKYIQSNKNSLDFDNVKNLWTELTINEKPYLIGMVYGHLDNKALNIEKFSVIIHNLFQSFNLKKLNFSVVDDFNINLMQYSLNNSVRKYANSLLSFFTKCIINRIASQTKTLLNHTYINSKQINISGGISRQELADHLLTFALIQKIKDKTPERAPNFFNEI